jgi:hypothetical protein
MDDVGRRSGALLLVVALVFPALDRLAVPLHALEDMREADAERVGDARDRAQRGIVGAGFDAGHMPSGEAARGHDVVLRLALLLPDLPDALSDRDRNRVLGLRRSWRLRLDADVGFLAGHAERIASF